MSPSSFTSSGSSLYNSSQTSNCEWIINVSNCFGQEYYQIVYGVTTYLSLFIFLCSLWLLPWRLYSKSDVSLLKLKGFLTLEGFLFLQIFWGIGRVFSCIMLIYDLFPGQWILREVVLDLSWFLGLASVATYLAGVLLVIPRMHFFRQNPHYKHASHLPNLRGISSLYISFISVSAIIRIICSISSGYFRQYQSNNSAQFVKIADTLYYCISSICALSLAVGFMVYGNRLVEIASEGLHLLEDAGGRPKSSRSSRISPSVFGTELGVKYKKLQRSVRKMRIVNAAFILSFMVLGVIFAAYAFLSDQIIDNLEVSQILAALSNWLPMILDVFVMAGIAYGEMKVPDKSEPLLENIVIPTPSNASQIENISDTGGYHSRNNSTDSEAPLLRWPAPAVTSTRRGSAQLDSPISIVSSSSPLNSTPITSNNDNNISMSMLP